MSLKSQNPTKTTSWEKLTNHFNEIKNHQMVDFFNADKLRSEKLLIKWNDFYVDFSKNRINKETINSNTTGTFDSFVFQNYIYTDLEVSGVVKNKIFNDLYVFK